MVQAPKLRERHTSFTVMSCDNLPGNGKVAKDAVVGLADLNDSTRTMDRAEAFFPNGMVDRIATVTTDQQREN